VTGRSLRLEGDLLRHRVAAQHRLDAEAERAVERLRPLARRLGERHADIGQARLEAADGGLHLGGQRLAPLILGEAAGGRVRHAVAEGRDGEGGELGGQGTRRRRALSSASMSRRTAWRSMSTA
jgi:hypothetical protein